MKRHNKKKILIIDNSIYLTGALKSALNFTERLSCDFEFQFLMSTQSTAINIVENLGYKVHRLPLLEISKSLSVLFYIPYLLINTFKLKKIISDEHISVLHVNDLYNQLGTLSKILNPKLSVIYHVRLLAQCYLGKFYYIYAKLIQLKADKIICVSEAVYLHFRAAKQAEIIADGLTTPETLPEKKYWQNWPVCNILYLANYIQGKGHIFALKALRIALNEYPNINLKMMGSTNNSIQENYFNELNKIATDLDIQSNVTFFKATSDVEYEMKNADIVMNLSESESFSMVCFEALHYGVPLIASDCGGPAELFENNKSGILVKNRNSHAAAQAIIKLMRNPKLAEDLGKNGKEFVEKKFDQVLLTAKMKNIYQ